jgi:hypothetical protein
MSFQVAKEAKGGGAGESAAAAAAVALSSGAGWTPNVASGEYNTDDIDKRLEVLLCVGVGVGVGVGVV